MTKIRSAFSKVFTTWLVIDDADRLRLISTSESGFGIVKISSAREAFVSVDELTTSYCKVFAQCIIDWVKAASC